MLELTEANSKTIDGVRYARPDFLVVEDPDKISTWHLPVKKNGKPDRRLAGAAWAALYNPNGFRGNRYEGPKAASAKRALRALYKAQEWDLPASEDDGEIGESYDSDGEWVYTYGAVSFTDLDALRSAQEMRTTLFDRTAEFTDMLSNILYSVEIADKIAAMRALFAEYTALVGDLLSMPPATDDEGETQEGGLSEAFAEQIDARALILESDGSAGPRDPLHMQIAIIEPGWGNSRDNHYYPGPMLHEYAQAFVGAKMYASGHGAEGRTVRNEVSVIEEITGFSETGAPIARVAVFDPDFAEQTRNRAKAGHLGTLECSILAKGRVKEQTIDGRPANVVEAITAVQSVDWVTRAGAGGRALGLQESEEDAMDEQDREQREDQIEEQGAADEQSQADDQQQQEVEPQAETQSDASDTERVQTEEGAAHDRQSVTEALHAVGLPAELAEQFAQTDWADQQSVQHLGEVVADAIRVSQQPGRPFAQGVDAQAREAAPQTLQEQADHMMDEIFRKHGLRV